MTNKNSLIGQMVSITGCRSAKPNELVTAGRAQIYQSQENDKSRLNSEDVRKVSDILRLEGKERKEKLSQILKIDFKNKLFK